MFPWALKFLWGPAVDRFSSPRLGARRSWILPLQTLTIAVYGVLIFVSPSADLTFVMIAFFFINFFSASQDVATDALAIDLMPPEERGWANGVQVAGYRIGMILGGGPLLALYDVVHWQGVMAAMAAATAFCTIPILLFKERAPALGRHAGPGSYQESLFAFFRRPGAWLWLAVLLLYKSGHALATAMLRPWLVDHGYSMTDIAWVLGSGGFVAGFAGAMTGGWLAARFDRARLLIGLGFLQCLAVAAYLWPALTEPAVYKVLVSASFDHFTSGMATVTLFTLMMDASDRSRAATDYTLQASVVVVAQTATSALSGWSAERFGYGTHFAMSASLGVAAATLTALVLSRTRARVLVARDA